MYRLLWRCQIHTFTPMWQRLNMGVFGWLIDLLLCSTTKSLSLSHMLGCTRHAGLYPTCWVLSDTLGSTLSSWVIPHMLGSTPSPVDLSENSGSTQHPGFYPLILSSCQHTEFYPTSLVLPPHHGIYQTCWVLPNMLGHVPHPGVYPTSWVLPTHLGFYSHHPWFYLSSWGHIVVRTNPHPRSIMIIHVWNYNNYIGSSHTRKHE